MSADGKRIWPRSGPREGAEPAKEMEKKQAGRQAGRRRAGVPRRREDMAVSQTVWARSWPGVPQHPLWG